MRESRKSYRNQRRNHNQNQINRFDNYKIIKNLEIHTSIKTNYENQKNQW